MWIPNEQLRDERRHAHPEAIVTSAPTRRELGRWSKLGSRACRYGVALSLALWACACWGDPESGQHWLVDEDVSEQGPGRLEVTPAALDFGPVCTGAIAKRSFTLRNTGASGVTLSSTSFGASLGELFTLDTELPGAPLDPGESLELTVLFAPVAGTVAQGEMTITASSEAVEPALVSLSGSEGGAELELAPEIADLGPVAVGETVEHTTRVRSVGERALTVTKVTLSSSLEADELWLTDLSIKTFPASLEPGENLDVTLALRPAEYQPFSEEPIGTLTIQSSDCSSSLFEAPVLGWPGGVSSDCVPLIQEGHVGRAIDDVDVLFVVDNSASMADEQAALGQHFAQFLAYADGLEIDYLIGVTTTDTESDAGTLQGSPLLITPGLSEAFLANVQVGTSGSDSERGLEASLLALQGQTGDRLGAHIRPDANLAVIYVSDDDDHSSESIGSVVSALQGVKASQTGSFAAHALVAMPPGCAQETENYGARYTAVADATGGASTSICDSDFEQAFSRIGVACFGDAATFHLEQPAKPETLEVLVNGLECEGSWSLSPDVSSVVFDFDSDCFPQPGTPIVIRYEPLCWPEDVPKGWQE